MSDQDIHAKLAQALKDLPGGAVKVPTGIVGAARRRHRRRLLRMATSTIAVVGVTAVVSVGVWRSSNEATSLNRPEPTGASDYVLRLAPVQIESLGGLVRVNVPVLDGLVAPDAGAPQVTVYRPNPQDRQVTIVWVESPTDKCGQVSAIHVDERVDSVVVELTFAKQSGEACAADARQATATIPLSGALGTRPVEYPETAAG